MIEAIHRRSVFDTDPLSDTAIVGHASKLLYYPSPGDGIVRSVINGVLTRVEGHDMRVRVHSARDNEGNMLATEISRIEYSDGTIAMGSSMPVKQISVFGSYKDQRICIGTTWHLKRVMVLRGTSQEFVLIKKRFFHMGEHASYFASEEDDPPLSCLTRIGIAEALGMQRR